MSKAKQEHKCPPQNGWRIGIADSPKRPATFVLFIQNECCLGFWLRQKPHLIPATKRMAVCTNLRRNFPCLQHRYGFYCGQSANLIRPYWIKFASAFWQSQKAGTVWCYGFAQTGFCRSRFCTNKILPLPVLRNRLFSNSWFYGFSGFAVSVDSRFCGNRILPILVLRNMVFCNSWFYSFGEFAVSAHSRFCTNRLLPIRVLRNRAFQFHGFTALVILPFLRFTFCGNRLLPIRVLRNGLFSNSWFYGFGGFATSAIHVLHKQDFTDLGLAVSPFRRIHGFAQTRFCRSGFYGFGEFPVSANSRFCENKLLPI